MIVGFAQKLIVVRGGRAEATPSEPDLSPHISDRVLGVRYFSPPVLELIRSRQAFLLIHAQFMLGEALARAEARHLPPRC